MGESLTELRGRLSELQGKLQRGEYLSDSEREELAGLEARLRNAEVEE